MNITVKIQESFTGHVHMHSTDYGIKMFNNNNMTSDEKFGFSVFFCMFSAVSDIVMPRLWLITIDWLANCVASINQHIYLESKHSSRSSDRYIIVSLPDRLQLSACHTVIGRVLTARSGQLLLAKIYNFWQVCSFVGLLLAKIYNFWLLCSFVGLLLAKIWFWQVCSLVVFVCLFVTCQNLQFLASMFVCRGVCLSVC